MACLHAPTEAVSHWGERISRRQHRFGLYGKDCQLLPDCDVTSVSLTTVAAPSIGRWPRCTGSVHGPVLFAGSAPHEFGFILMNSLGRLWALDDLPPDTSLFFITKYAPSSSRLLRPILRFFGVKNPAMIHNGPLHMTEMSTATDLYHEGQTGQIDPVFRSWLDRKLPERRPIEAGRKVYVTRARLGSEAGRMACEPHLEALLRADGYEIFAPEAHDLATQFATFSSAESLIFTEGSALHFYAYAKREGQRIAVIQRRRDVPPSMKKHLQDFDPTPTEWIDAISSIWWPPVRSDNVSVAVIDFMALRKQLVKGGFLSAKTNWTAPSNDDVAKSVHAGVATGTKMLDEAGRAAFMQELRAQRRALAAARATELEAEMVAG